MPIQLDELPDDVQAQILREMGLDAPAMESGADFSWGGLRAGDIGGLAEFGADDLFNMGVGALSAINFNASAITNIGNLIHWGVGEALGSDNLKIVAPFLNVGEMGIGFGAEGVGDDAADLANFNTRNEFEF